MPPVVAAAAITGLAGLGTTVAASKIQSGANKRALQATERGAERAEAFTREQDAANRADEERRDAEDRRRWEIEQQNLARDKAERDARQSYEDTIRYGKMVNLARLTGQPIPERPNFAGGGDTTIASLSRPPVSAPLMSRPSAANQMIAQPGAIDPLSQNQRMPLSNLVGKRRVI